MAFIQTPIYALVANPTSSTAKGAKDSKTTKPHSLSVATQRRCWRASTTRDDAPQSVEPTNLTYSHVYGHTTHRNFDEATAQESASLDDAADAASIYDSGDGKGSSGGDSGNYSRGDEEGESGKPLPDDMHIALASGALSKDSLARYYAALRNPLTRFLLSIPAFRTRFLADSAFLFKLLAQELIGNGTALASEIAVRGKDIVHELEYVASDLIVGTVIEAAFVWLLAPTLSLPMSGQSAITKYFSSLPANIFQPSTALQQFSLSQRTVSFFYAGAQYALVGFVAGIVGTAITYGIIETRKYLDKSYKPERPLPAVIPNSAAWGAFMGLSGNTRFQIVEGFELGIARLFAGRANSVVNSGIIALRFANNYWGGVQFVQFFRYLGLHATGEDTEH